jgi:uncharacterized membrane protein YtjA (UPF0391 family)
MLGWMILFALMAAIDGMLGFSGIPSAIWLRIASILFFLLFVISLLGRAVRDRAH